MGKKTKQTYWQSLDNMFKGNCQKKKKGGLDEILLPIHFPNHSQPLPFHLPIHWQRMKSSHHVAQAFCNLHYPYVSVFSSLKKPCQALICPKEKCRGCTFNLSRLLKVKEMFC